MPFTHKFTIDQAGALYPHRPADDPASKETPDAHEYQRCHVRFFSWSQHILLALVGAILLLWAASQVQAQAACTHWASPQGSGSTCTQDAPCRIGQFWGRATPGTVLCLNDGTYTDTISPPSQLAGTSGAPITIRASTDGKVLIDAQHQGFAVWLSGTNGANNDWFVIEGVNARNGLEAVYRVSGDNNILRRVIGWDGTSGQSDSNIFRITGTRNLLEDCAGWGMNARKIIDGAQAGNMQGSTVRRCWAEWNDWPAGQSHPINSYQMGYNSYNQQYENILGTTRIRGEMSPGDHEGVMRGFHGGGVPPFDMQGTKMIGALFYTTPGAQNMSDALLTTDEVANLLFEDVAAVVDPDRGESVTPWWMGNCVVSGQCMNNVCKNCLAVHDGRPASAASNAGWSFPGLRQGQGLAQATGGQSAFTLLPGLCKRVVGGVKTEHPLWPWAMNQRIKDARQASGAPVVDVTATVESILGPIPAACKGTGPPPSGDTVKPTVPLTAPAHESLMTGTAVALSADAADNVGVVAITFTLNGEPVPPEQPGASAHVVIDSTRHPNGLYTLGAVARDAAGNVGVSNQATVLVWNASTPIPPTPGGPHPAMACRGAMEAQGVITMACQPVAPTR